LPFAKWAIKLETLPPGHAATMNIPIAVLGNGSMTHTKAKVKTGKAIN